MKLMKPLLLATTLVGLASCQTPPLPEPLDVPALQREAVEEAEVQWCRGQEPLQAFHPAPEGADPDPVTEEELLATIKAFPWVGSYIAANNAQWEEPCL